MPKQPYADTHNISLSRELKANIKKLPEKDRGFATSLCDQFDRYGRWSDKQHKWAVILADRATGRDVPKGHTVEIGVVDKLFEMFDTAERTLKRPNIVIQPNEQFKGLVKPIVIRPDQRDPNHRVLYVLEQQDDWQRNYLGHLTRDGSFTFRPYVKPEDEPEITKLLSFIAEDPYSAIGALGRITGRCCFCNNSLKDEKSTELGYGPTCARKFGMPWGVRAAANVREQREALSKNKYAAVRSGLVPYNMIRTH